jgi:hypothetical protein
MVVNSGNGVHAYWKVDDLDRESFVLTQLALLQHFKTDESVWTVLQLMRCPGFRNTKNPQNYIMTELVNPFSSGKTYCLKDFPKEIFNLEDKLREKAKRHIDRLEGRVDVSFIHDVNAEELPEEFYDLMLDNDAVAKLFHDPESYKDRSAADMKLTNALYKKGLTKKQALSVVCNTQKALEKGPERVTYAAHTVDKVYTSRSKFNFRPVSQVIKDLDKEPETEKVRGPRYLDEAVLGEPWRKQELLGIIAGPGVGKTAKAMNIIRDIIKNNPENDDVFIFFTIEMPEKQIIKRWQALVGEDSSLNDRFYVIGSQDSEGNPLNVGLQEIYTICKDIKTTTGRNIGALVIDHFHIISPHVNINITPTFGAETARGNGPIRTHERNEIASQLKSLVKSLDTFGIILSQTTKEKGVGDTPVAKDGSYGTSQFEWIMDRIITIWQPLMRVQGLSETKFLAYQYVKIREKTKQDRINESDYKLLVYNMDTGNLRIPNGSEYEIFAELLPQALERREAANKNKGVDKGVSYSIQDLTQSIDKALNNLKVIK